MESHREGLTRFYSSQAEVMLAQYENINRLLGPTKDWTHPGTHCEILLREFLRRHLLQGLSVDKGYIFGRCQREGREYHGPEIDILIHDTVDFRPVFRLDDFVIVQPEAVRGMIQVKRTFKQGKNGPLASGLAQSICAKQHLLDILVQEKVRTMTALYGGDDSNVKKWPELRDRMSVFTAVVAFDEDNRIKPEDYENALSKAYSENGSYAYDECEWDTCVYVLPDFVGSLKYTCLWSNSTTVGSGRDYCVYNANHNGINISLHLLLYMLTEMAFDWKNKSPPFAFPENTQPSYKFRIPKPSASRGAHAAGG